MQHMYVSSAKYYEKRFDIKKVCNIRKDIYVTRLKYVKVEYLYDKCLFLHL